MTTTQPAALPELNPADIVVDVVCKALGGFAPVNTSGVRVTHKPSGVSVTVDSERSQHKNKHLAWEKLRAILAALQPQPAAVSDEQIRHDANLPFVEDEHGAEWVTLSPAMFARAVRRVLALRPQAVPMTNQELTRIAAESGIAPTYGVCNFGRRVEAHHRITAQGAQGGEAK